MLLNFTFMCAFSPINGKLSEIIIRKPFLSDIEYLETLFQIVRHRTFTNRPKNEFQLGDYQKSTSEDEVWIAEEMDKIVGFVSIYYPDNFIHNLFVYPSFQKKGIGTQLLKVAEKHLLRPMTLKIALDNLKACSFYEKYGWQQVSSHLNITEPYLLYKKN